MSRWIRVQTSIFDHEAFAPEPLTEREAWLWLIANAAWKDTRHRVGSQMVEVPVGSLFVTLRGLQNEWKWGSDFKVRSFLALLRDQEMIVMNSNAGKTQITICNYSRYQNLEREENAKETHEKRTENALKTPVHQYTKDNTSSLRSDVCPEPEISAPVSPTVIDLPATKNELVPITEADVSEWTEAFPGVNVRQQLRSMRQWLITNPSKRKTSKGTKRFVVAWLTREQDRGGVPRSQAPPAAPMTAFQQRHQTAIDAFDRKLGIKRDDEFTGDTLDLGNADYRAH